MGVLHRAMPGGRALPGGLHPNDGSSRHGEDTASTLMLRVHATNDFAEGPSMSRTERRGGENDYVHINHKRTFEAADASIPYHAGDFTRAMAHHPVQLSSIHAEHADRLSLLNREHEKKMQAQQIEHEISLSQLTSQLERDSLAGKELAHIRESNLSAVYSNMSDKHGEAIQDTYDAMMSRRQEAVGMATKAAVEAEVRDHVTHLKNLKAIQIKHREKLMELDEERLGVQCEQASKVVNEQHESAMSAIQRQHEHKMEMLANKHATTMAKYTTKPPTRPTEPKPPSDFGVVTGHCLWQLGLPDEYVEQCNLAKKLETALICVSAERPENPCARLAELLQ